MNYLHFNPVKHGYVERIKDWQYSSFHRLVKKEVYSLDWGGCVGDFEVGEFNWGVRRITLRSSALRGLQITISNQQNTEG